MTSVTSLNFIYQLVLHCVSRLVCTWSWNELSYFCIKQPWESVIFFVRLYCLWSKFSRLNFLVILSWTNVYSLWCFIYKSFCWDSERWLLTMRVKFLCCNSVCRVNFIGTWAWSGILNILNWVIIRVTITNVSWRWSLLRINSTLCWILRNSRLSEFLLRLVFIWYISFSLIHTSDCFARKTRWWFKSV